MLGAPGIHRESKKELLEPPELLRSCQSGSTESTGQTWALPRRSLALLGVLDAPVAQAAPWPGLLVVPLQFERGAFLVNFTLGAVAFRGVMDTGSPYLLVSACVGARKAAGRCEEYCARYGCGDMQTGRPSGLPENIIMLTGASAAARWQVGNLELGGTALGNLIFGMLGQTQSFGGNAGAPNFGLIREGRAADSELRPTFLGQTAFTSLAVDLRDLLRPKLELRAASFEQNALSTRAAKLLDLQLLGAPLTYYAAEVESLIVDGVDILRTAFASGFPGVVAILDTGTTGLALPELLFQSFDAARRARAREAGVKASGNVEIKLVPASGFSAPVLQLRRGRIAELGASLDIVTALNGAAGSVFMRTELAEQDGKVPPAERPAIIFLGLGFLLGLRLEIDTNIGLAKFVD
ncbi:unnamed protein product [Polarella glacialis]|uniref:Peptidase A1 domain-containing protein n=1 Tax=Polarella glacialis TaxID=89957 RepID=A0A813GMQ5_POLGL|nr:unnamed protein product [Polarella glacialis]